MRAIWSRRTFISRSFWARRASVSLTGALLGWALVSFGRGDSAAALGRNDSTSPSRSFKLCFNPSSSPCVLSS